MTELLNRTELNGEYCVGVNIGEDLKGSLDPDNRKVLNVILWILHFEHLGF